MSYVVIHHLLKDGMRRRIIEFLGSKQGSTYSEILADLGVSTGKLNYHLRLLAPLIVKEDQHYSLNEIGFNAYALLKGLAPTETATHRGQLRVTSLELTSCALMLFGGTLFLLPPMEALSRFLDGGKVGSELLPVPLAILTFAAFALTWRGNLIPGAILCSLIAFFLVFMGSGFLSDYDRIVNISTDTLRGLILVSLLSGGILAIIAGRRPTHLAQTVPSIRAK